MILMTLRHVYYVAHTFFFLSSDVIARHDLQQLTYGKQNHPSWIINNYLLFFCKGMENSMYDASQAAQNHLRSEFAGKTEMLKV